MKARHVVFAVLLIGAFSLSRKLALLWRPEPPSQELSDRVPDSELASRPRRLDELKIGQHAESIYCYAATDGTVWVSADTAEWPAWRGRCIVSRWGDGYHVHLRDKLRAPEPDNDHEYFRVRGYAKAVVVTW